MIRWLRRAAMAEPRLACVAHRFPLPADDGSSTRVAGMLGVLAGLGEVRLAVPPRPATTPDDVAELERRTGARVLGGLRPTRPHPGGPRLWPTALRRSTPPWFLMWFDHAVLAALRAQLAWATHVVALDDFAAQYLLHLPRGHGCTAVLDKHKVYAAPAARGEPPVGPLARARDAAVRAVVRRNEARTMAAADVVIVTSTEEDERLASIYGRRADAVVPSAVEPLPTAWVPPPGPPARVLWLGTADSRPNREGLVRLFDCLRRRAPSFRLVVAGRGIDAALRGAAEGLAVDFAGFVPDLGEVVRACHAAVLPLWAGGGGRLKALTLLGTGIPVVATPAALEGLAAEHGRHCLVAADPDGLCERLQWAVGPGRDAAAAMGQRAREWVCREHTWAARAQLVRDAVLVDR